MSETEKDRLNFDNGSTYNDNYFAPEAQDSLGAFFLGLIALLLLLALLRSHRYTRDLLEKQLQDHLDHHHSEPSRKKERAK
jgi:hypothetical protein